MSTIDKLLVSSVVLYPEAVCYIYGLVAMGLSAQILTTPIDIWVLFTTDYWALLPGKVLKGKKI